MRIEHVALYVKDLEAAREFFVTYLEGRPTTDTTTRRPAFAPISSALRTGRGWSL